MNIIHDEGKGFYIYGETKKILAELNYKKVNDVLIVDHTEVSEDLKGQGIAGKLFSELIKYVRENNYKIDPVCSYIEKKMQKSEYDNLKI
ncbi:MAG: GNAT family N-acetyltransferase [Fusobacteriales bacterium]|nr:MAG: GNAT family N-acetyltransferase [Fusobacteriales bacterium]